MKVLNLYAGIGGNRELWGDDIEVTAVEIDEEIAGIYKANFPKDKVIVGDAHQYLLDHYKEFDFIWSSPPCSTHSRMRNALKKKVYPNMQLYEEIIFLSKWFKGYYVVENVIPYYKPLIKPSVVLARHSIWANFNIPIKEFKSIVVSKSTKEQLAVFHGINVSKRLHLRNCVNPQLAKYIMGCLL